MGGLIADRNGLNENLNISIWPRYSCWILWASPPRPDKKKVLKPGIKVVAAVSRSNYRQISATPRSYLANNSPRTPTPISPNSYTQILEPGILLGLKEHSPQT